eukprot:TRINITY_DN30812_c0_g1_i2.p1 TRINITY_DN30812_c0_g1~~TRINITY_DN30812_c0_g1_i2.p1  ORF type:complete len:594 (+),score=121.00 TRINITY_DN30812_c0_g1_i2:141-1922(+)
MASHEERQKLFVTGNSRNMRVDRDELARRTKDRKQDANKHGKNYSLEVAMQAAEEAAYNLERWEEVDPLLRGSRKSLSARKSQSASPRKSRAAAPFKISAPWMEAAEKINGDYSLVLVGPGVYMSQEEFEQMSEEDKLMSAERRRKDRANLSKAVGIGIAKAVLRTERDSENYVAKWRQGQLDRDAAATRRRSIRQDAPVFSLEKSDDRRPSTAKQLPWLHGKLDDSQRFESLRPPSQASTAYRRPSSGISSTRSCTPIQRPDSALSSAWQESMMRPDSEVMSARPEPAAGGPATSPKRPLSSLSRQDPGLTSSGREAALPTLESISCKSESLPSDAGSSPAGGDTRIRPWSPTTPVLVELDVELDDEIKPMDLSKDEQSSDRFIQHDAQASMVDWTESAARKDESPDADTVSRPEIMNHFSISNIRAWFDAVDTEKKGYIARHELVLAVKSCEALFEFFCYRQMQASNQNQDREEALLVGLRPGESTATGMLRQLLQRHEVGIDEWSMDGKSMMSWIKEYRGSSGDEKRWLGRQALALRQSLTQLDEAYAKMHFPHVETSDSQNKKAIQKCYRITAELLICYFQQQGLTSFY